MSDWRKVSTVDAVDEDEGLGVVVDDLQIGIFLIDGVHYACENVCPHGAAFLSDGFQEDGEIECPLHQGRFDIKTGQPTSPPVDCPIRTYPVKVEGEDVFVDVGGD
jgi:nitrite reductase/ring-hydroxylating ferredoxin subunit